MFERLLIALIIGALAAGVYLLLNHWQRRRATATNQQAAAPGQARVLYFHSEHCRACRAQGHYLAQLDDLHRALIEPVEVEQSPELARQYNILTVPTTILIDRTGRVRYINPGLANLFKLTRQLEDVMKL
ncbi:MAG: thioredoxin family protein [Anaerolineales bacterium]|nr:thioredoxin family protein [Anaerolineales bacterium]